MGGRRLTSFEHILLGLICIEPSSGYDLKRIFAVTPMGVYQPSSGTVYPALRRLELVGMIQTQTPSGQNGSSARHRRVYDPPQAGRAAHALPSTTGWPSTGPVCSGPSRPSWSCPLQPMAVLR